MPPSPLVTIAIPTYNRATSYFPEALQSALGQTYTNLEILVCDNGSTDGTAELVRNISDPRLRYIRHEKNIGQRNNYHSCFQQARGGYVLLLHDDDFIDEDFVSACMTAAAATPDAGVIRTGVRRIDGDGNIIIEMTNDVGGLPVDGFFLGWLAGRTAIYCCNTLFSTDKLRGIGGFRSKHFCYPDTAAIFLLAARYPRIDIAEVKASFRIHAAEAGFARRLNEWCEDSLELLKLMADLAPDRRQQILREGARFFAKANYHRATAAPSPGARLENTLKVMRFFKYRQLPQANIFLHILRGTAVYNAMRLFKRRLRYGFVRNAASTGDA